jgi:hypothetical protein
MTNFSASKRGNVVNVVFAWRGVVSALALLGSVANTAHAASVLDDGSEFEAGWTITNQGSGGWYVNSGLTTPLSSDRVAGAADGVFYAVSDAAGPGARALSHAFTVPTTTSFVELSFKMFVDSYGGRFVTDTLTSAGMPNQYARVDLLTAGASAFDTTTGVIANLYAGTDSGNVSNPYSNYRINISSLVTPGGTYQIRFANVANQGLLHQGVDAVRIVAEIPEPGTYTFFAVGLGLMAGFGLRARRRSS